MKSFDFLSIFQNKLEELGFVLKGKTEKDDDMNTLWECHTPALCKYAFLVEQNNNCVCASIYKKSRDIKDVQSAMKNLVYLIMFILEKQCFFVIENNDPKTFVDEINKITDYYFSKVEEIRKNEEFKD